VEQHGPNGELSQVAFLACGPQEGLGGTRYDIGERIPAIAGRTKTAIVVKYIMTHDTQKSVLDIN
jgi:hypothetical protein